MSSKTSTSASRTHDTDPSRGTDDELLRACFDRTANGQIVLDGSRRIVAWNRWIARSSKVAFDEARSRRLEEIFGSPAPRLLSAIRMAVEDGSTSIVSRAFTPHALPLRDPLTGRAIPQSIIVTGFTLSDGRRFCRIEILDMSRIVAREHELVLHRDELECQAAELERLDSALGYQVEELERLARAVRHDLKEPLRSIQQCGDFLLEDLGGALPDNASWSVDHITGAVDHLAGMVDDLLDLSNTGSSELQRRTIPLRSCVDDALEALADRIADAGATIEIDDLPEVIADRSMVSVVYRCLIGNAIKFARDSGTPHIRLTAEVGALARVFGVTDNGVGISPNRLEEIFLPFKKLHSRSRYDGNGIGLSICRTAIARHGGKIWAESSSSGSSFYFTLPGA